MHPLTYAASNDPHPHQLDAEPPLQNYQDMLYAHHARRLPEIETIRQAKTGTFATLTEAKQNILGQYTEIIPEQGGAAALDLVSRTFDMTCAAYALEDSAQDVLSLYVYLSCTLVPFAAHTTYGYFHYEHPGSLYRRERGRTTHNAGRYPHSSFVIASSLCGTSSIAPEALTLEAYAKGCARPRSLKGLEVTQPATWNRMSGVCAHAGPKMPGNAEEAFAPHARTHLAAIAEHSITDKGVVRIVSHGGVRLKEQFFDMDSAGRIQRFGRNVSFDTVGRIAPEHHNQLALC